MSKIETITTRIRPTKKLCIIDDSFSQLFEVIKNYSDDVGGFYNLILINDETLFKQNIVDFINSHDPDLIINYSKCENSRLQEIFQTRVIDAKISKFSYRQFQTPLVVLDNISELARNEIIEKNTPFFFYCGDGKGPTHSYLSLNYGILSNQVFKNWEDNEFFRKIAYSLISPTFLEMNYGQIKDSHENTLLRLSNLILRPIMKYNMGKGSNFKGFLDKPSLIIGSSLKIQSYIYFWNIRATYPTSNIVWVPYEMIQEVQTPGLFARFSQYCLFDVKLDDTIRTSIKGIVPNYQEIDTSIYYFDICEIGWNIYDHVQTIIQETDTLRIIHPQGKLLSKRGFNENLTIQISGPDVTFLPKSLSAGQLFINLSLYDPHHFARMSSNGLCIFFSDFNPLEDSPYIIDIKIPTSEHIFSSLLSDYKIQIKETNNSHVINQIINCLNGIDNIKIMSDPNIFELIVKLTPQRINELIKKITKNISLPLEESEIRKLLTDNLEKMSIISSNKITPASHFLSLIGVPIENKEQFYKKVQELYNLNILLRGKKVICPSCNSTLWFSLSDLNNNLICYCCNNPIELPIFNNNNVEEDSYRLNELFCTATDQGILPLLLTTYVLNKQNFVSKKFIFNCELYENAQYLAEVDIILTLGNLIGLVEVKTNYRFKEEQLERMLEIANKINANFLVFSSLKEVNTPEILELQKFLESKNLKIPAFILTKEILFNEKIPQLFEHLRALERYERCSNGPIIIK